MQTVTPALNRYNWGPVDQTKTKFTLVFESQVPGQSPINLV